MLRYLLDTNIVIYVLKRRPVEVLSVFNANANRMAISSITLAELLHGAEKSTRVHQNLTAIEYRNGDQIQNGNIEAEKRDE